MTEYRQCDDTCDGVRCVMFAGHKTMRVLGREIEHNHGGLGPFTPGMDPGAYIRTGNTHMPGDDDLPRECRCVHKIPRFLYVASALHLLATVLLTAALVVGIIERNA